MCIHHQTCGNRMIYGDMPNGCTDLDGCRCMHAKRLDGTYKLIHIDHQRRVDGVIVDLDYKGE